MKKCYSTQFKDKLVLQHLGLNVKTARLNQNLSLETFSKLTGLSEDLVNKIEAGEIDTNISVISLIAGILKVELVSLFDFDGEKNLHF